MDESVVLDVGNSALYLIMYLSAPLLLAALVVGLIVSVLQAATQIQEQTLSFIPKLVAIVIALVMMGPWMLQLWLTFTHDLFMNIPAMIG
ncbi:MAG: flagellar biosynthesis protein FliQ [Pseudomonadota bacterium]